MMFVYCLLCCFGFSLVLIACCCLILLWFGVCYLVLIGSLVFIGLLFCMGVECVCLLVVGCFAVVVVTWMSWLLRLFWVLSFCWLLMFVCGLCLYVLGCLFCLDGWFDFVLVCCNFWYFTGFSDLDDVCFEFLFVSLMYLVVSFGLRWVLWVVWLDVFVFGVWDWVLCRFDCFGLFV